MKIPSLFRRGAAGRDGREKDPPAAQTKGKPLFHIGRVGVSLKAVIYSLVAIALVIVLVSGATLAYQVFASPQALFERPVATLQPLTTPGPTPAAPGDTAAPEPQATPTMDPYEYNLSIADREMMKGIVNVLVIGVDYAEERSTWNKNFYSDVMLVLAINFNENTVDMISIPRDTYAKIANIDGFYKLNSSVHHGGGVPAGFPNVCKSVSGVLGGIPVDYYVGVTMPTVKELVNAVGGVDFDVDVPIRLQGRSIEPGFQHMDGQMVLDYLRARKGIDNDLGRVNRQKRMLVAIFEKMQREKSILEVPSLVLQFKDKVYTNMSTSQFAALAAFAYKLDPANIRMHTMSGTFKNIYNWLFIITDQKKRVELIKEVYGIEVPEQVEYSLGYCTWQWADIQGRAFIKLAAEILEKDDQAATRRISWENRIKVQQAMDQLAAALNDQADVPARQKDSRGIEAAIANLENVATPIFRAAGYSVRWYTPENPGDKPMTG